MIPTKQQQKINEADLSGRQRRRLYRSRARAQRKADARGQRSIVAKDLAPNARDLFPALSAKRRETPGFRNIFVPINDADGNFERMEIQ